MRCVVAGLLARTFISSYIPWLGTPVEKLTPGRYVGQVPVFFSTEQCGKQEQRQGLRATQHPAKVLPQGKAGAAIS